MKYVLILTLILSATLSLTGCGYKGPLTLPQFTHQANLSNDLTL